MQTAPPLAWKRERHTKRKMERDTQTHMGLPLIERERKWEMKGQIHRGDTTFHHRNKLRMLKHEIQQSQYQTTQRAHKQTDMIKPHTTQHQPKTTETTQNKTETNVNNTHSDVG